MQNYPERVWDKLPTLSCWYLNCYNSNYISRNVLIIKKLP